MQLLTVYRAVTNYTVTIKYLKVSFAFLCFSTRTLSQNGSVRINYYFFSRHLVGSFEKIKITI